MEALLRLETVSKHYPSRRGFLPGSDTDAVRAVNQVTLAVSRGQRFGIVGESGSGKTTLARIILGLTRVTEGRIYLGNRDVTRLEQDDLAHIRRNVQMVFQDPLSSLNPKKTVRQTIMLPLQAQRIGTKRQQLDRVRALLHSVGLAERYLDARPDELSGGQRQRVGIARALAIHPTLLVLDEPTSSLDVSIQAKVLSLLADLHRELGIAQIMISHNLGVIRHAADRVGVMYLGHLVEAGSTPLIFSNPAHPYTRALFSAIPVVDDAELASLPEKIDLRGEIASAARIPAGCPFHPRCPKAMDVCSIVMPAPVEVEQDHMVRCHLYPAQGPAGDSYRLRNATTSLE